MSQHESSSDAGGVAPTAIGHRQSRSRTGSRTRASTIAGLLPGSRARPQIATSASRQVVDLLVLGADDVEDLQIRGSRGGSASDWPGRAPCFALAARRARTQTDASSRPPFRQLRGAPRRWPGCRRQSRSGVARFHKTRARATGVTGQTRRPAKFGCGRSPGSVSTCAIPTSACGPARTKRKAGSIPRDGCFGTNAATWDAIGGRPLSRASGTSARQRTGAFSGGI